MTGLAALTALLLVSPGIQGQMVESETYMIHLKEWAFNPASGQPDVPAHLQASSGNRIKLLQVDGPMCSEWLEAREREGVVFLSFMQDFTYIAYIAESLEAHLASLPGVLWIGDFHPAYKIQECLLAEQERISVNILVWDFNIAHNNKDFVKNKIDNLFGDRNVIDVEDSQVLRAHLSSEEIIEIAKLSEVHWIDRHTEPMTLMNNVRIMTGANSAASGGGFDGTGIVGEVKDNGIQQNHPDFDNLIGTYGSPGVASHGTCTFGIVFSTHTGNAKGMMYNGEGVFCDWDVSRMGSINNLKNTWGGVFQSNSWSMSYSWDGDYTSYSYDNDNAINTYDVNMLYSAGNSDGGVGSETISQDSAAKNVICVGAVYHQNTAAKGDDQWENWGTGNTPSQGPAKDNRIKPDLCAVFDYVYTTDRTGSNGYSSGDYYSYFGGTSAACPIVAGGAGLVYQMYEENHFGNNPGGSTPHAATIKAMLIANAYQYSFSQATRYRQGWGLVDVGQVYNAGSDQLIVDGGDPLNTGQSTTYYVERVNSTTPLKVVLCWTDEPGETSSSKALINDLDLTVTTPGSTTVYGNAGLVGGQYSSSGGSSDRSNNVECVFIQNPTAGTYEIVVNGYNIAQDNDPATGVNQAYSLVVSECLATGVNHDPILSYYDGWSDGVDPNTGDPLTTFDFKVHYYDEDADNPTVGNVVIDSTPYAMSGSGSDADYSYSNSGYADGTYGYYFYFEDGNGGTVRFPAAGEWTFVVDSNHAPVLSNYDGWPDGVDPDSGDSTTTFDFKVHYYDVDADNPTVANVVIDSTPYAMSGSGSDADYSYSDSGYVDGPHGYYFYFEDGNGGTARLPSSGEWTFSVAGNHNPDLTNPDVTPSAGYYGQRYEYSVDYYDSDGDPPTLIQVNIDGTNYDLTLDSGTAANGTYHYLTRDLDTGVSHTYYFYAEESLGGSDRNPTAGTYSGPTNYDPELYWSGTPAAGAWLNIEVWGCPDALWAAAWSTQPGPHYVQVTGLFWDIGPADLRMAKKIIADPVHLDAFGYGTYDFKIPNATSSGTKYMQAGTKLNAFWGQSNQETFIVP